MRIAVIGTGYVGLVTAACLADFGHTLICVDKDRDKIESLRRGRIPIYESGLEDLVARNAAAGRLHFTTDLEEAADRAGVIFIAVGTPPRPDGSADLGHVEEAVREIAPLLHAYTVIVDKSTVPVGTARRVKQVIASSLKHPAEFDVVSNPEFLREGSAVNDFMHPDRVVIGAETERARGVMREIYRALYLIETPFVETDPETAELIKYASNAFLAAKIAFINEMANLCEAAGADVQVLAKAVGMDGRIGPKFLHAGPGYGGSCFPKDTKALAHMGRLYGEPATIIESVVAANERQKRRMVDKIDRALGGLRGRTIAVLGLSFKPNTDDMREAPSVVIIHGLLAGGAAVRVNDPAAMEEAEKIFAGQVAYCADAYEAAEGADAVAIVTEWNSYRRLDLARLRTLMRRPVLLDLRNIYEREEAEGAGFEYFDTGRAAERPADASGI